MWKILKYIISTCAFCILGIKTTETPAHQSYHTDNLTVLTKKVDQLIEVNLTQRDVSIKENIDKSREGVSPGKVVVIDNLKSPGDYKHSDSIIKELSKHQSVAKHCDLAYSLPQGGIAIHLKKDCESLDFIQNWQSNLREHIRSPVQAVC